MDETPKQPLVFANKVLLQLIQHTVAEDAVVQPKDFMVLRTVFRACGGSWEALGSGDPQHIDLLKSIVAAWGQMPGRTRESDLLV